MKLTRIQLTGFKSFAGSVALPFDEGITAIVGPNGCGKSNISDAVRWVLGEQRARLLRGAKMEDVIFHGAQRHRPVSVAEVALVFDNHEGLLPVSYREVEITRRLSRSGQSDYLLNQSSVRLRDVQDLLRGTGLGSDAGVVIEAQMIDRLLSDRPDERRSLFEEAAGIGLYRDRKESTERQLARTSEDLQRLEDVINEIQREVRSLVRQRGRAERAGTLAAERFAIVLTLTQSELAGFGEQAGALAAARREVDLAVPARRAALEAREREREGAAQARHAAEARRTELERRLAAARLDVERLEGDLKLAGERLQHAAERRTRAQAERGTAVERASAAERARDAAAAERRAAGEARQSVQGELDLRTQSEETARQRLGEARGAVRALEESLQAEAERLRALAGEGSALERDLAELRHRAAEAERARAVRRAEREAAETRQRDAERLTQRRGEESRAAETELERARHALAAAREHEEALRTERRAVDDAVAGLAARQQALERLEREREGLAPAARRLLEAREQFGDGAVLGPLSDFLRTSRAEAGLVERLFGEWLHAVLVRDDAVEAVRRWHEAEAPGPLVLLPASGPVSAPSGAALPVEAAGPAAEWARALLAGQEVLDAGGHAIRRPNGAVVLVAGTGAGPLARRADLAALTEEIADHQRRLDRLQASQDEAARAHAAAEAALEGAGRALDQARAAAREAQAGADDAKRLLQRLERELLEAEQAATRLSEQVSDRADRLAATARQVETAEAARDRLERELAAQRAVLGELEAQQEAARERRVHWQVEEAQVAAREAAARDSEERAAAAFAAAQQEIAALDEELTAIERDTGGVGAEQQQWRDTLAERRVTAQELEVAAQAAEAGVGAAEARLADVERAVTAARAELEAVSEQAHRLEVDRTELDGRRRALVERVEAEWRKPLEQLFAGFEPVAGDLAALREEAERLAQALEAIGPVNPLAVEEHAEEVKRLDFLTTQRDDLVAARATLQQALHEIEQTARAMFTETFAAIRQHFRTVFQTLFEGGECDVRLADEADPLNSDIEIQAAPRGKRTQRIHLLSSGERALVAISLLFAIYLTKPSPFCLLDEVDAPLDDANVVRFVRLLSEFKRDTQFIVITHNPRTMQVADAVYGVTMQEPGVSTIVGVRLGELEQV
jgi:chromosome segregation protein